MGGSGFTSLGPEAGDFPQALCFRYLWWPRRVRPLRPGPKLKAASANQKAEAAFCGPLRLYAKPKRPFVSRCGLLKSRSGLFCPLRPVTKPKRPGKSRFGLTICHSGLLKLLYYNIHFYYNNRHAGKIYNSPESGFLIGSACDVSHGVEMCSSE